MTSPTLSRVVLASRGSKLALTQTESIAAALRAAHPGLDVAIETVSTTGDRDQRPFAEIGGKGLFTTEVERAVADGRADVAVHSAKDLTAALAPGMTIVCVPRRALRADVVVGGAGTQGDERLGRLPERAKVGTSSIRRRALLAEARPDLQVVELRGNLDTRLAKVADGAVDVAILAAAGIERLLGSLDAADAGVLPEQWWTPAPGQGALAIEGPADRADIRALFAPLEDPTARAELDCERSFSEVLEGGCTVPLGCSAVVRGADMSVSGYVALPDASYVLRDRISGPPQRAAEMGVELARALLDGGADQILEQLRDEEAPEPQAP